MDKRVLVIVVVVAVVAAGLGVHLLSGGASPTHPNIDASLSIYGNADNDYKIDDDDVSLVRRIIEGSASFEDYPLADANCDGLVDERDIEHLNGMIERRVGMTIYLHDDSGAAVGIEYPLKHIVPIGTNLISAIIQVGGADRIVGYTKTNYGIIHRPMLENTSSLGGSIYDLNTDESLNAFIDLDSSIMGGVDAVLAGTSATYLKNSKSFLEGAGITILRFDTVEGMSSIGGILTIGYILGEDTERQAISFSQMSYEVLDLIKEKLDTVTEVQLKKSFSVATGSYLCGLESDYTHLTSLAGSPTVSTLTDKGSRLAAGDEYYLNWDADFIISYRTLDYSIDYTDISTGKTASPSDTWKEYMIWFKDLDCYGNMIYINNSMPVVCRIAYLAEIFYPEVFEEGFAHSVHQGFVDNFMSYLGDDFDVTKDMTCIITYDMVKDHL